MKKRTEPAPTEPPPCDFAAELARIDAEDARLAAKVPELESELTTTTATADQAEKDAAALSYQHDVDNDVTVIGALEDAEASADGARRKQRRLERTLRELADAREALRVKRRELVEAEATAKLDAIARERILPALARADAAIAELSAALSDAAEGKRAQSDIATAAGVRARQNGKRFQLADFVGHVLRWKLGDRYAPSDLRHRYCEHQSLVDVEQHRQGFVSDDTDTDTTGDADRAA